MVSTWYKFILKGIFKLTIVTKKYTQIKSSGDGWVAIGFENGFLNRVSKEMETTESGYNKYQHNDTTWCSSNKKNN